MQAQLKLFPFQGRTYPVQIFYAEAPVPDYIRAVTETVLEIHRQQPAGDILAFLTGQDEVMQVVEALEAHGSTRSPNGQSLLVLPLYGGLPGPEQMRVFDAAPTDTRKVIVTTNIAEASVTIDGIVFVVDTGFVKMKGFNARTGIESLVITPISKASASQRAGRAGRNRSGKVFRLYTEVCHRCLGSAHLAF